MPSINTIREFDAWAFYHVYNRGASKQTIFFDNEDRHKFISILERYLNPYSEQVNCFELPYPKYDVKLIAYCLMDNHFHLMLEQLSDIEAISKLMHVIEVSYTVYFNKKYGNSGCVLQGRYKASHIDNDAYYQHITRYIHLNPGSNYATYRWSSVRYYITDAKKSWVHPLRGTHMNKSQYRNFLHEGHRSAKKTRAEIAKYLADS